jgi:hypothetical protein
MDIPVTDSSREGYFILHARLLSVPEVMSDMIVGRTVEGRGIKRNDVRPRMCRLKLETAAGGS